MSFVLETYDPGKSYTNQKKFKCGIGAIDRYARDKDKLHDRVARNLVKAFVLLDTQHDDQFVGYYTLQAHTVFGSHLVQLSNGFLPNDVPCVKLNMLGVDQTYKGQGLGRLLLRDAIERMVFNAQTLGIFGLYLDADPGAVAFYDRHSFVRLTDAQADQPTPMFLLIETARQAL